MALADAANVVVNDRKPWELAKRPGKGSRTARRLLGHQTFRLLTLYLKPVLPTVATAGRNFLGIAPADLGRRRHRAAAGHAINAYSHLMTRIDPKQVVALVDANKESLAPAEPAPQKHAGQEKAVAVATGKPKLARTSASTIS